MKKQNQTQPISTLTNKQTSKKDKPPSVPQWNDNKDEYGFDEDCDYQQENDTRHQERDL